MYSLCSDNNSVFDNKNYFWKIVFTAKMCICIIFQHKSEFYSKCSFFIFVLQLYQKIDDFASSDMLHSSWSWMKRLPEKGSFHTIFPCWQNRLDCFSSALSIWTNIFHLHGEEGLLKYCQLNFFNSWCQHILFIFVLYDFHTWS